MTMPSNIIIETGSGIDSSDTTYFTNYSFEWNNKLLQPLGKPQSTLDLIFVVDTTGSMAYHDGSKSRYEIVKDSLIDVLQYLLGLKGQFNNSFTVTLTIIRFAATAQYICDRIEITSEQILPIVSTLNSIVHKGGTNMGSPYDLIKSTIDRGRFITLLNETEYDCFVFFMTDGIHNVFDSSPGGFSTDEIVNMYSFIKSNCISLGIGDHTQYDKHILENISSQLRSANDATAMKDHIVGVSFGKCTIVAEDMIIKFPKLEYELISPTPIEELDGEYAIKFNTYDMSQRVYFSYAGNDDKPLSFTVTYHHVSSKENKVETIITKSSSFSDIYTSRHLFTKYSRDFLKLQNDSNRTKNFKKHREDIQCIQKLVNEIPIEIKEINSITKLLFISLECAIKSYIGLVPYITTPQTVSYYTYVTPTISSMGSDISCGRLPSVQRSMSAALSVNEDEDEYAYENTAANNNIIGIDISKELASTSIGILDVTI